MKLERSFFRFLVVLFNLSVWYLWLLDLQAANYMTQHQSESPFLLLFPQALSHAEDSKKSSEAHVYVDQFKETQFKKWMTEYLKWHANVLNGNVPEKERKYVLCKPINAMGNIVQVAVPCVLYGMLYKRAVLIDTIDNHFIPLEHWPWDDPPESVINFNPAEYPGDVQKKLRRLDADSCKLNVSEEKVMMYGTAYFDFFGSIMLTNPDVEWVNKNLPANWFQLIFDRFFPLKPHLRQALDSWKRSNLGNVSYLISLQIRAQLPTGGKGYTKTDHWFAPPLTAPEVWFQTAEYLTRSLSIPYNNVGWFLATQNETLIQWFKEKRKGAPIFVYDAEKAFAFEKHKIEGKLAGVYTFYIMKESDDILTTDFSSYGQTAAASGGLMPIVCTYFDYCQRRLTAYPGTQQPAPPKPRRCSDNQYLLYPAPDMSASFYGWYYRFIHHPEVNN